jgi:hypothetical protein
MTTAVRRRPPAPKTPDSHSFPTRPYDLVKEFSVALGIVLALSLALAAVFSSPDRPAISLADWAHQAPNDVVATATAELAGTSTSAGYGAPYNTGSPGQKLGPLALQKWAGVQIPVDSAKDLVLDPLSTVVGDPPLTAALNTWSTATGDQQATWAAAYSDALAATPDGSPATVKTGVYGPVPVLASRFLTLAGSGGLQSQLAGQSTFYSSDQTRPMLLLADGAYLEDQARAENLGGDQWGMMNESGNYPGQPWMWLYTFWYQIKPFSTSDNADALVWGLMMLLTALFIFVPFIPGLRSLPKHLGVHKLIWRK